MNKWTERPGAEEPREACGLFGVFGVPDFAYPTIWIPPTLTAMAQAKIDSLRRRRTDLLLRRLILRDLFERAPAVVEVIARIAREAMLDRPCGAAALQCTRCGAAGERHVDQRGGRRVGIAGGSGG